jgi:hypothetical protein
MVVKYLFAAVIALIVIIAVVSITGIVLYLSRDDDL